MIGNGPAVKGRHPGLQQLPNGGVVLDAGLCEQFGRQNARLEDIRVPEGGGQCNTGLKVQRMTPVLGQSVQHLIAHAQNLAALFVIGGHLVCAPRFNFRPERGKCVV